MALEWGKMAKGLRIHPPAGCRSVEADGQMLEYLSRQTADIMRRMAPPVRKPRGRPKSSQSSLLQCSRLHFRMLVQLYCVCTGKVGRKVLTTPRDLKRAFHGITKAWAQKDAAIWAKAKIVKPAGLGWGTGRAREWWAVQDPSDETARTLCEDIAILKVVNKAEERREESAEIRASVRRREELAASGRMKWVIQGILGKPFHSSIIEVIESPDGPITDQAEIQAHLTKEWEAKFQHPAGSLPHVLGLEAAPTPTALLPSASRWEEILQNPKAMRDFLLADDNVHVPPAPMIDINVDAFSNTTGRGTAEEELALALAEPFSVDEMRQLIKKKSNTAPGLSGLT
jgi:hypothetical protein